VLDHFYSEIRPKINRVEPFEISASTIRPWQTSSRRAANAPTDKSVYLVQRWR